MADPRRFCLLTLGCKINQYESQSLREAWMRQGYAECSDPVHADLVVVNTCAVTARAVQDARRLARKIHRESPQASIVLTGCAAQVFEKELGDIPGVTRVVPQSAKTTLLRLAQDNALQDRMLPATNDFSIADYNRARAVLKIQDGCSHRCTYCIVPKARGPSRSRPPKESLAEAERLAKAGVPELIVAGTNLRQYGRDLEPREDVWDFLLRLETRLSGLDNPPRLRLSSLEPSDLTGKGLETLSSSRLVVPHLHLSLQSASPDVLRRMARGHYNPENVAAFLDRLRKSWTLFGLGADFLLGFPGESESEFQATVAFVRDLPFTYAHVFSYSPRPGTAAADMPDRVDPALVKERSKLLRGLVKEKKKRFLTRLLDEESVEVVVEEAGAVPYATRGTNAYYVECVFAQGLPQDTVRKRLQARPLRIRQDRLVVQFPPGDTR